MGGIDRDKEEGKERVTKRKKGRDRKKGVKEKLNKNTREDRM